MQARPVEDDLWIEVVFVDGDGAFTFAPVIHEAGGVRLFNEGKRAAIRDSRASAEDVEREAKALKDGAVNQKPRFVGR